MTRTPRNGHGHAPSDGLTVLLVDANVSRKAALAAALAGRGPQVRLAESGAQAFGMLHGQPVDALVLRAELPLRGAVPIIQRVRADEGQRGVVVVVLGGAQAGERERVLAAGADDYLSHDIGAAELTQRLRHLTQLRAAQAELLRRNAALSGLLQAESARAAHFELLSQNLLEASAGQAAIVDSSATLVAANRAFYDFLRQRGASAADAAPGRPYPAEAVAGDAVEGLRLTDSVLRVLRGDTEQAIHEFCLTGPPPTWLRARIRRFVQAQIPHALIVHEDVTQQHVTRGALAAASEKLQESQAHVMHAQKMDAIGRLVSGVSHDFNNHLTSIICFTRFVVDEMAQEDPRRADLVEVLRAADNAARLTNQLLTFSRRRPVQPTALDLNASLLSLGRVLRRMLGERVELVILPSDEPAQAMSDPGQFDQLIFSLALRAKEQMGEQGGAITLKLGHVHEDEREWLELLVSDTSAGMSAQQIAGVFEPYAELTAATKSAGDRATGLDLAACAGIVQQAGGRISIASEVGRGTTFRVLLPRLAVARRAESGRVSMPASLGLHGIALVVEDQPAILRTMSRALKAAGLSVLEASSGEDAMAVLSSRSAVPELVVTDMMLPGMSGVHLVERLRSQRPRLPVVYVSGYASDDVQGVRVDDVTAFVAKPFTSRQLISRAAGLMTRAAPNRPSPGE